MRKVIRNYLGWASLFVFIFFSTGCYTQLARPTSDSEKEVYYDEDEYQEEGQYVEEEPYEEEYEDVYVQRTFYHDVHVFGYYDPYRYGAYYDPFVYDPFYDPFYYDPFFYDPFFYSSVRYHRRHFRPRPTVFVGFYDPIFWCGTSVYDPWYYPGFAFGGGFYWGGGYWPHHRGHDFDSGPPNKKRSFGRGGTTVPDDFGRLPGPMAVSGSEGSGSNAISNPARTRNTPKEAGVGKTENSSRVRHTSVEKAKPEDGRDAVDTSRTRVKKSKPVDSSNSGVSARTRPNNAPPASKPETRVKKSSGKKVGDSQPKTRSRSSGIRKPKTSTKRAGARGTKPETRTPRKRNTDSGKSVQRRSAPPKKPSYNSGSRSSTSKGTYRSSPRQRAPKGTPNTSSSSSRSRKKDN